MPEHRLQSKVALPLPEHLRQLAENLPDPLHFRQVPDGGTHWPVPEQRRHATVPCLPDAWQSRHGIGWAWNCPLPAQTRQAPTNVPLPAQLLQIRVLLPFPSQPKHCPVYSVVVPPSHVVPVVPVPT